MVEFGSICYYRRRVWARAWVGWRACVVSRRCTGSHPRRPPVSIWVLMMMMMTVKKIACLVWSLLSVLMVVVVVMMMIDYRYCRCRSWSTVSCFCYCCCESLLLLCFFGVCQVVSKRVNGFGDVSSKQLGWMFLVWSCVIRDGPSIFVAVVVGGPKIKSARKAYITEGSRVVSYLNTNSARWCLTSRFEMGRGGSTIVWT